VTQTRGRSGQTIQLIYDTAGRLVRVEYPDNKTVSYQYDACGNRTRLTYPDSTYVTYEYDELNRLPRFARNDILRAVRNSSGAVLAQYSYDDRSRRTRGPGSSI
jgi:YD repeat-containing protein